MPKTTKQGKPKKDELPSTLQKSSTKAQRTFAKAHDSAVKEYGEGQRAHRVAYSALKHSFRRSGITGNPNRTAARPINVHAAVAQTPRASRRVGWTPTRPRST